MTGRTPPPTVRKATAGGLRSFVAFLALLAAVGLLAVIAVLAAMSDTLLAPKAWLDSLEDARAYDRGPAAVADQVVAWVEARPKDQPRSLAPLDASDVRAVVVVVVTSDWLQQEARRVVPAVVGAAADGASAGDAGPVISLRDLKARLVGGPLLGALLDRIATWPTCTRDQLDRLAGGDLVRCQPPTETAGQLAVIISGRLSGVAAELPDEVDLGATGEAPGSGALAKAGLPATLSVASAVRAVLWGLALAMLGCVAVAIIAAGGPVGRRLRTVAAALLGAGLVTLLVALVLDGLLVAPVDSLRRSLVDGGLVPGLSEIVASAARALLDRAGWQLAWGGAVMVVPGLALLLAAFAFDRRGRERRLRGEVTRG
jgi:hypothetical protein